MKTKETAALLWFCCYVKIKCDFTYNTKELFGIEISTSSEPPEPEISQFVGLGNVKPLPNGTDDRCRADDKVQCKSDHSVYICEDQICDEHEDCPDGTDEQNCPPDPHGLFLQCLGVIGGWCVLYSVK